METTAHPASWLLEALRRIRRRPAMYLRDDRLNSLACYVEGVLHGRDLAGGSNTSEEAFLGAFGDWLGDRLDLEPQDCWFYLMRCLPERTGHIDDFYRELDRYLAESGFARGLDDERLDVTGWRRTPRS